MENNLNNSQESTKVKEKKIDFPFLSVIPYAVMIDKNLEPNAKLFFGCLTALSRKHGYCYASNEDLAEMFEMSEDSIKDWMKSLEQNKHIKRETKNISYRDENGKLLWKPQRKIYVNCAFSNNVYDKGENPPLNERGENPPHIKDKSLKENNTPISPSDDVDISPKGATSKPRKEKKKSSSSPITFNSTTRKFENLTSEDIQKWKSIYPSVHVENEIDKCGVWALDNPRTNYRKSIAAWLEKKCANNTQPSQFKTEIDKPVVEISEEEQEHNRKLAQEWEKKLIEKNVSQYAIYAKHDKVEFIQPNEKSFDVSTNLSKEEFLKKCQTILKRLQIL